jgi:hypothetical protein
MSRIGAGLGLLLALGLGACASTAPEPASRGAPPAAPVAKAPCSDGTENPCDPSTRGLRNAVKLRTRSAGPPDQLLVAPGVPGEGKTGF